MRSVSRKRESWFYIVVFTLSLFVVLAGFTPTYVFPLIQKSFNAKPFVHIHAALFSAWIILIITQPLLVKTGHTRIHKKIGIAGFILAVCMIIIGSLFAITVAKMSIGTENEYMGKAFLVIPLTDMLLFTTFIGFSYFYTRNPDYHKRLILLATTSLLPAAFTRIPIFVDIANANFYAAILIMDSFLFMGIIYDIIERRRINAVYMWGGIFLLSVHISRPFLAQTNFWLKISDFILGV